jgi:hypothetical protein
MSIRTTPAAGTTVEVRLPVDAVFEEGPAAMIHEERGKWTVM